MKKLSFFFSALLCIGMAHAQNVGIGTATPLQKLHVEGTSFLNGNVGIGYSSPMVPLSFNGNLGDKISLWTDGTATHYGFGIQGGLLQMFSKTDLDDIAFGFGSSSSFTERMRVKGNGNVGIGTSNPNAPLGFPAALGKKITLYPGGTGDVGMAVQGNLLQMYADHPNSDIAFGYDQGGIFTERMRVKGNGNVGLGVIDPTLKLDISGRMRIRTGTDGEAGIWLNNFANTALQAFIGLENDNYVGFYGSGAGWKFGMNTQTGALKINGTEGTTGQVLVSNGGSAAAGYTTIGNVINSDIKIGSGLISMPTLSTEYALPQLTHIVTLARKSRIIISANVSFQTNICVGCIDGIGRFRLKVNSSLVTEQNYSIGSATYANASIGNFMVVLNAGVHAIEFYIHFINGMPHYVAPGYSSIIILPVD